MATDYILQSDAEETFILQSGNTGPAGPQGSQGVDGPTGLAATITVGNVTTLDPGEPATVQNAGSSSSALFNFAIPQGESGESAGTLINPFESIYVRSSDGTKIFLFQVDSASGEWVSTDATPPPSPVSMGSPMGMLLVITYPS